MKTPDRYLTNFLIREVIRNDEYMLGSINKPIDYVIDIGANVGIFALHALTLLKINKQIISLEPEPNNFKCLQHNVKHPKAILSNNAIGEGKLFLTKNPRNTGMYQCSPNAEGIEVQPLTLKEIVNKYNISGDVIMKCDCEGGEVYLMNKEAMQIMDTFLHIAFELHYGDEYFSEFPSKEEYIEWFSTFTNHNILYQNWKNYKNGHVVLTRK